MTPTWVAARPMPSASCMSWPIRATSSRSASSKRSTVERAAAQHRVAVLAHELQRRVAARARLGVEARARSSARDLRCLDARAAGSGSRVLGASGRRSLLRVDVDAERHVAVRAVARRGVDGGRRRARRRPRGAGLDDDLEALAAAQAEQRRRAEHLGARERARQRAPTAPAAARAAAPSSAEQTTRIRSANGG